MASRVSRSPRQPLRPRPCPTGGPEEQWQRAIHERGEAVCPTCSVVTRKTLVGLKKHMEVCQKVRLPPGTGGSGGSSRPASHGRGRVCSCRTHSSASTAGSSSSPRPASTTTPWPSTAPRYAAGLGAAGPGLCPRLPAPAQPPAQPRWPTSQKLSGPCAQPWTSGPGQGRAGPVAAGH